MDLQSSFAVQGYNANRAAARPDGTGQQPALVADFLSDFAATVQAGETTAMQAIAGSAGPHQLVQALAQSELAVEAAVTIRDKVVEAYQEILRMPV